MSFRDFAWIALLLCVNFLLAVFAEVELVRVIQFQLVSAVMLALAYPKGLVYLLVVAVLLFSDMAQGQQLGLSVLVFCLGGLLVSLASNILPLLKQRPFWLARNFWLTTALIFVSLLTRQELSVLILYLLVNLAIINLLTLVTRKLRPANVDIFIN